MSKTKTPRAEALKVAEEIKSYLLPVVSRIEICGSIRRLKPIVGDIEVLFCPVKQRINAGLFDDDVTELDLAEEHINTLLKRGVIAKRLNVKGHQTWGPSNKYATHVASGIGIDFFATTEENWWTALVVRTGPAESNALIASACQKRGLNFHAYGSGYSDNQGNIIRCTSEQDVFEKAGLPYKEPQHRL